MYNFIFGRYTLSYPNLIHKGKQMNLHYLNNQQAQTLFQNLLDSMNEDKVTAILQSNVYTADADNWIALGNNDNNAAIVQNTAGNLSSCMAELTTNAIDAVIQREKNIFETVGHPIPEEHLTSPQKCLSYMLGDTYTNDNNLKNYASEKIKVITTESKEGKRNLTIVDQGCGQKAENFANTFCSVGAGNLNKAGKNWLHGNYGQGSTSANAISGKMGYKLIVSRENETQCWGFTLIRRRPSDLSTLEYLIVRQEDGTMTVPSFEADSLEFGYRITGDMAKGDCKLVYGSAIRLYDINFSSGFTGIKRTIGPGLFRPALPLKSLEYTQTNENGKKTNGRDSRWIFGLGYELDKAVAEGKAQMIESEINMAHLEGYSIIRLYFVLNQDPNAVESNEEVDSESRDGKKKNKKKPKSPKESILDWLPSGYKAQNQRVFHIKNGQVQHVDDIHKVGAFFPKARENVFIEIDSSNINPILAKAYLWKADRTTCQTSNEYFIEYDKIIDSYLCDHEKLKEWALICKNEEMARLKLGGKNNEAHQKMLMSLFNTKISGKYKANKKLIQSEGNAPSTHAQGMLTLIKDDTSEMDMSTMEEVQGKEVPTVFSSSHSTKDTARKATRKMMSTIMKTDAKKGQIGTKNATGKISIKDAQITHKDGVNEELDGQKMNLFVTQNDDGTLKCDINPSDEIKDKLQTGDIVTIKLAMTTMKDNEVHILEKPVYFEIIEELEKVKSGSNKKSKMNIADLVQWQYATRDGRSFNGQETAMLPEESEIFNLNSGYYLVNNEGVINILLNLDNSDFVLKLDSYKTTEDKDQFLNHWESMLYINVRMAYQTWLNTMEMNEGNNDPEHFVDEMNVIAKSQVANQTAIFSAAYVFIQMENSLNHAVKEMGKVA